jgi:predicted ATPase
MNKLVYIYVENFSRFEPIFLNLSNDFHCQIIEKSLFIHERRNFFKDLLGESVVDINVIAGENGVGKTQLLKMLAELACGATTLDYISGYDYVLVYQTAEQELVINTNIDITYYPEPLPGFSLRENENITSPVVYYSPFLDFNPLDIRPREKRKPIIDISLSHYIMQDTQQTQKKMDIIPTILTLKANSILRQIDFIAQKPVDVEIPFALPNGVYVRFNRLAVERDDISIDDKELFDKLNAYSARFFRESEDIGIAQSTMAKLMFYRNLLSLFFLSVNNQKSQSILHHRFGDGLTSEIDAYEGEDPYALIELFQRFFQSDDVFMNGIFQRLTTLAFAFIDSEGTTIDFGSANNHLTISVQAGDQRLVRLLNEIFEPEDNQSNIYITKELIHFISFDWRNFSSGEKSFLDLFARLFDAKKQLKNPSDTVLLLLDEAEIGFHPEWQKRFVSSLVIFLNAVFTGYSLQVIIATHSPLVLSDFPSERVHLFKREGELVVRGMSFGTFAQNIPELLARDFFIDTTLIGNFSKLYIDNILEAIHNMDGSIPDTSLQDIVGRIGKIDEPVIKKLLIDSLSQKIDVGN